MQKRFSQKLCSSPRRMLQSSEKVSTGRDMCRRDGKGAGGVQKAGSAGGMLAVQRRGMGSSMKAPGMEGAGNGPVCSWNGHVQQQQEEGSRQQTSRQRLGWSHISKQRRERSGLHDDASLRCEKQSATATFVNCAAAPDCEESSMAGCGICTCVLGPACPCAHSAAAGWPCAPPLGWAGAAQFGWAGAAPLG